MYSKAKNKYKYIIFLLVKQSYEEYAFNTFKTVIYKHSIKRFMSVNNSLVGNTYNIIDNMCVTSDIKYLLEIFRKKKKKPALQFRI